MALPDLVPVLVASALLEILGQKVRMVFLENQALAAPAAPKATVTAQLEVVRAGGSAEKGGEGEMEEPVVLLETKAAAGAASAPAGQFLFNKAANSLFTPPVYKTAMLPAVPVAPPPPVPDRVFQVWASALVSSFKEMLFSPLRRSLLKLT